MSGSENSKGTNQSQVRCEDIQELLFDYMSRELGQARSVLVREHLRKCEACTRQAAEIQSTLDLLSNASKEETNAPSKLTDERRKKLYWWYSHPIMLWIEQHHMIVSLIITILVLAIAGLILARTKGWKKEEPGTVYPVFIGKRLPAMPNAEEPQEKGDETK